MREFAMDMLPINIGLPFDNPLGDIEHDPPASGLTVTDIDFLTALMPRHDVTLQLDADHTLQICRELLLDGSVSFASLIGISRAGRRLKATRVSFDIHDPDNPNHAYSFELLDASASNAKLVADYGVIDLRGGVGRGEMIIDAISLNAQRRYNEAPDTVPPRILTGKYSSEVDYDRFMISHLQAIQEVCGELPEIKPMRKVRLSQPLAAKILPVVEAVVLRP